MNEHHFPTICCFEFLTSKNFPQHLKRTSQKTLQQTTQRNPKPRLNEARVPRGFICGMSISSKIEIILRIARSQQTIKKIHFVTDKLHII